MECKSSLYSKKALVEYFRIHKTTLNHILDFLHIQGIKQRNFISFTDSDKEQIIQFLKEHPNTRVFFQQQTFLQNYGVKNPLQCSEIKAKVNQTIKNKYGVSNISQNDKIKQKKTQTLQAHYGQNVINPMDSLQIREAVKQNWANKSQEEKDILTRKTQQTKLKKYGNPTYNNGEAISSTRLLRTKEEIQQEIQKARKTKIDKYGNENYNNREQTTKTMLKKYGVKSLTNTEKSMKTKLRNHTVVCKNIYYYNNLEFASSWELYFYIYYKEILHQNIQKGKTFPYEFKNKTHYYICDFLLNEKENIEIKGNQYLDKTNNLYFPYVNQTKVNAQEMQEQWAVKQRCMRENKVKIISQKEILPIIKKVREKFGKNYINQFKK